MDELAEARENIEIYRARLDAGEEIGPIAIHHLLDLIERLASALDGCRDSLSG